MLRSSIALALICGLPAFAATYETFVDVGSEQDLYDLQARGDLSAETAEALVELLQTGVDLSTANRDELYALPNLTYAQVTAILEFRQLSGGLTDPAALVHAGILSEQELMAIAPFLVFRDPATRLPFSGRARLSSRTTLGDPVAPPAFLKIRANAPQDLSFGLALASTRHRLGSVSYDPNRDTLAAFAPAYGLALPKFWAQWKTPQRKVIAGTFQLGFGERLTLDTTSRYSPDGFYPDDVISRDMNSTLFCREAAGELGSSPCADAGTTSLRMTRDYKWKDGFRGLAGTVENLDVGQSARLALHAFGSYQRRSVYQYQVYDRARCDDPTSDDPDCSAPHVYRNTPDPTSRFSYMTLPDIVDEWAGGGNATLSFGAVSRVGFTGYFAAPVWRVAGMQLDFQEWSPWPRGGPFGAMGLNGATRLGPVNMFLEVARSLDSQPSGGGFAAIQRNTWTPAKRQELEFSLRYYDKDYANPYAGPIAAADIYEGNRARNELGARLKYTARNFVDWDITGVADFWVLPSQSSAGAPAGTPNLEGSARATFKGFDDLELGVRTGLTARGNPIGDAGDALESGTSVGFCEVGNDVDELGACFRQRYVLAAAARWFALGKLLFVGAEYQHRWRTDPEGRNPAEMDHAVWAEIGSKPLQQLQIRGRLRYLDEDLADPASLERSTWAVLEGTWLPSPMMNVTLRYDLYALTDERRSTASRTPNPEHRILVELESRF